MSLANLQLRNTVVEYNGTPITVYGLSANDIAGLVLSQMDSIEQIFDVVESAGVKSTADLAKINMAEVAQRLMVQVPGFIAHAIAYAAREPEYADKVLHIDAPTQVKLLRAIAELTFNDEAGFREFVGNVVAALRSAKGVVPHNSNNIASLAASDSPSGGSESAQPSLS